MAAIAYLSSLWVVDLGEVNPGLRLEVLRVI
jgi:hypothetical protein